MISVLRSLAISLALLGLLPATAQLPDESILLDLSVNFGVAFREASWVPVDVFVNNTERDVDGFVEVRLYDFSNNLLSPTYRLPAVSPKNSRKRFRLYCMLTQTDRLEVQLFQGNRAVTPVPAWVNLTPIDKSDFLGLVLDDQPHDYGFLSSSTVIGDANTRFHREGLATPDLGYLPDHLPCYTTFDLIVLGNIDPERIGPAHRELLQQYVSRGGVLVVSLGANANQYQGSWLEPLMGVTIGENTFLSEAALAADAYAYGDRAGATDTREGMVTRLQPVGQDVQSIGANYRIGAARPVGAGHVVTFSVDSVSGLLQRNPRFLQEWNRLLNQSHADPPLNLSAVAQSAAHQLPTIAGVKLFPISSIITYLLLYFFIAIVGNWLFWNWKKRREMAWVCLVFFSLAFTSYAMFFGTQGRARSTELEQLEILELGPGSATATLHGITGLLAKGSGRFDAGLIHPDTLVSDVANAPYYDMNTGQQLFVQQNQSPFHFIQGENPGIERLTVGASEMRLVQTETSIRLDGTLTTNLQADATGLRGTIRNDTGLQLVNPHLFYEGRFIALDMVNGQVEVSLDSGSRGKRATPQFVVPPFDTATVSPDMEGSEAGNFNQYLSSLPQHLFMQQQNIPPVLVAWARRAPYGSLDMGDRAEIQFGATLVVAWLHITPPQSPASWELHSIVDGSFYYDNRTSTVQGASFTTMASWLDNAMAADPRGTWRVRTAIPDWLHAEDGYRLEIELYHDTRLFYGNHGECHADENEQIVGISLTPPRGIEFAVPQPKIDTRTLESYHPIRVQRYHVDDWKTWLPRRERILNFLVAPRVGVPDQPPKPGSGPVIYNERGRSTHIHAYIRARMVKRTTQSIGE